VIRVVFGNGRWPFTIDLTNNWATFGWDVTARAYHCYGGDIAEVTEAVETIEPGEIVALDEVVEGKLRKSNKAYDRNVVGIVSTEPGMVLNNENKAMRGIPYGETGEKSIPARML
jgi:hypothetical protein